MSLVVSYGGGNNSAAMLVGLHEHGERPDAIVFADTGGEKPRTYGHLWTMQAWCERVRFPSITIVRAGQPMNERDGSLEAQQLRLKSIPSRAFGFGQCSAEWKIRPMEKWCASRWPAGYVKAIGFHAGEAHRALRSTADGYTLRYPLIEWRWDSDDCERVIERAGLPQPGKSACFFCPSSSPAQILKLRDEHPDLLRRALAMEANWLEHDGGGTVKGLGRRWSWAQLLRWHDSQPSLFDLTPEELGGCNG